MVQRTMCWLMFDSDLPRTVITRYPTGFLNMGDFRSFGRGWVYLSKQPNVQNFDTADIDELLCLRSVLRSMCFRVVLCCGLPACSGQIRKGLF